MITYFFEFLWNYFGNYRVTLTNNHNYTKNYLFDKTFRRKISIQI